MRYLRSFVIGSSFPVFVIFFLVVMNISTNTKNYTYENYTLIAPIYLGVMNMLALYLANEFELSLRMRYIIIGIISPLVVIMFAYITHSYNFNGEEWRKYAATLVVQHFLIFNIIVYGLEKLI
jgi:hypothetical protein